MMLMLQLLSTALNFLVLISVLGENRERSRINTEVNTVILLMVILDIGFTWWL